MSEEDLPEPDPAAAAALLKAAAEDDAKVTADQIVAALPWAVSLKPDALEQLGAELGAMLTSWRETAWWYAQPDLDQIVSDVREARSDYRSRPDSAPPTSRDGAPTVAEEIRVQLQAGKKDHALRTLIQLNDDLVAGRIRELDEPGSTGDPVWDATIAALVAWRLGEAGLQAPAWVNNPDRFLPEPRILELHPADPVPSTEEVPPEFAKRGVIAWAAMFESV